MIIKEDDLSNVEIEIMQSKQDTIAARLQSFNPKKSIFSEFAKGFFGLREDDDFTLNGYAVFNLSKNELNGHVEGISGIIENRLAKGSEQIVVDNGKFEFFGTENSIHIQDAKIKTEDLSFFGNLRYEEGFYFLEGNIRNLSHDRLLKYWDTDKAQKAREWYKKSMLGGKISYSEVKFDQKEDIFEIKDLHFDGAKMQSKKDNLDLVLQNGSGVFNLYNEIIDVSINSVDLYNTSIKNAYVAINTEDNVPQIKITGSAKDSAENLLLIAKNFEKDQINKIENTVDLKRLKGNLESDFKIELGLRENIEINLFTKDAKIPNLFGGFDVENGNLSLAIRNKQIKIKGFAFVKDQKIDIDLEKNAEGALLANVNGFFDLENLKDAGFVPDLSFGNGRFSGSFDIKVDTKDKLSVDGYGKFVDAKSPILESLGWQHDPNAQFFLSLTKDKKSTLIKNFKIEGEQIYVLASGNFSSKQSFLSIKNAQIGQSFLDLSYKKQNARSELLVNAKDLDFSKGFNFDDLLQGTGTEQFVVSCKAETIKLKNQINIKNAQLNLDNNSGQFYGNFEDNSIIKLKYDKKLGIEFDVTNAGTFLKSLDVTKSLVGGRASVHIETKKVRNNKGFLRLDGFFVKDAPALAQILSLASLTGVISVLNGDGIYFNQFTSEFTYGEGIINFKESWLESPALGISAMGLIGIPNKTAYIKGSVVPLYRINKIIWNLPIIGKIVTGGGKSRGIFAPEYTVKQESGKFSVSANALTAITPTVFKKFLDVFD